MCEYCNRAPATTTAPVYRTTVTALMADEPAAPVTIKVCQACAQAIASVKPGIGIGR